MPQILINEQPIELDAEGFLRQLDDWSPEVAEQLAQNEGLELTQEHWEIIELLRAFYQEFELSPAMRILVKQVKNQLGTEKGNSMHLMRLFPGSPAKVASKIAGLPKPTNCL
ncbi:TusE/DsrC/DsvC family sulfur relay protein [Motiliproteus coralliicola]|uniref:Sulfurtransferase n=1 Tax=Motiliproteus coralliicola TaxID=2283196 RepID=A0A369WUJ3_9GAMM|nr:TusE/DsrC/DsvC family sulfur relay protein [Motiliproteus coralliicola]RDE25317.1 TusE/DsrC/DsvC family sulfur relay protein [Motiliproteus coralliicola]